MRVAIVGAGAAGCVYGARLARWCEVDVIARSPAPAETIRLERVDGGEVIEWRLGRRGGQVPVEADVVLVTVRYENLDEALVRVSGSAAPVVVLTPMLPQDYARLSARLPDRIVAGMPSVVAYRTKAGVVRYWLPRRATTWIEARSAPAMEAELAGWLVRAGIESKLEHGVLARNVATTVSFLPLAMAIDAGGGIQGALEDRDLLALALEATKEGCELGRSVGKAEAWASTLLRFVGPRVLRAGVALARARAPEALRYADVHFGQKLHAQNVAMGAGVLELAESRGVRAPALARLVERLRASPSR